MGEAILNVPLPAELEAYLKKRVREGSYRSPVDYIRALILEDRQRRARASLDHLLVEGLDSEPELVTPEYLAELRRDVQKRIRLRRKGG